MKLLNVIVLFHVLFNCSGKLLIEKAALFANSVFKEFLTSVVWWNDHPDITEFIKKYRSCIVVSRLQNGDNQIILDNNKDLKYQQTVFFANDVDEIEYFLTLLNQNLVSPIRLIVVLLQPSTYTKLSELTKIAWTNDVADILILNSETEDVSLTTYFPYGKGNCGDHTPVKLDHNTVDIFPKKFINFHGCEIRAILLHMSPYSRLTIKNDSVSSISGIDGNVLKILFGVLNATIKIVSVNNPGGVGSIVNGTATGGLAELVYKKGDIICPALIMTYSRYAYVQFSHVFESCNVHWFGPRQRDISEWVRVLQPFMSNITPALLASSIFFVVVVTSARRLRLHNSVSNDNVIFVAFIIFIGQEVKFASKSWFTNTIFMLWIWFCIVVRIVYQGVLVDGLQKTILEDPLGDFDTAVNVIKYYGGIASFQEFYTGTRYYNDYKVINFRNLTHYLKSVEAGKKFLLITDKLVAMDSAPKIQVLSSDPVTQPPVSFQMRPGWPAVANINSILLRMIEVGLTQKIGKEYSWEWMRHVATSDNRDAKALTLETLIGCFYGLGFMYAACMLILIIEIITHRLKQGPNLSHVITRKFGVLNFQR